MEPGQESLQKKIYLQDMQAAMVFGLLDPVSISAPLSWSCINHSVFWVKDSK